MKAYPYNHVPGTLPPSLARLPVLRRLPDDGLDQLLQSSELVEWEPGECILREGHAGEERLLLLLKGRVRVSKEGKDVTELDASGQVLGELALLRHGPHAATVEALSRVFCLRVDAGSLDALDASRRATFLAALYRFLAEMLADRLAGALARIAQLEAGR